MLALVQTRLFDFRRSNPWLKQQVISVPFNVVDAGGKKLASFPGTELVHLTRSIRRFRNGFMDYSRLTIYN